MVPPWCRSLVEWRRRCRRCKPHGRFFASLREGNHVLAMRQSKSYEGDRSMKDPTRPWTARPGTHRTSVPQAWLPIYLPWVADSDKNAKEACATGEHIRWSWATHRALIKYSFRYCFVAPDWFFADTSQIPFDWSSASIPEAFQGCHFWLGMIAPRCMRRNDLARLIMIPAPIILHPLTFFSYQTVPRI